MSIRLSLVATLAFVLSSPAVHAESLSDSTFVQLARVDLEDGPRAEGLEVEPVRVLRWGGGVFVQVEQRIDGLEVVGGRITLAYDVDGALLGTNERQVVSLPPRTAAVVSADLAIENALGWRAERGPVGVGSLWAPRSQPGYLQQDGQAHRVWLVDVSTAEPVSAERIAVDAVDGRVLGSRPTLWTALADVYPTNPIASELTEVELADVDGDVLANDYATVQSCTDFDSDYWRCDAKTRWATPDDMGDFFFEPAATSLEDPFAEVQMFWHLDRVARWFEDEFGFRTDFGLAGTAVEGIVNFPLSNAFYGDADGDGVPEVAFGQGSGVDFSYDADVIYHEFGHAVFGSVVDADGGRFDEYGRLVAPSGLNEGSADLFALALTGDPELGEYAGGGFGGTGAIRHLDEDRHCPTDIYGESHADGEIWAAFGWNVIEDPELGAQVAAHLVFGALNSWSEDVTWYNAGQSLLGSADALLESSFVSSEQHALLMEHIERSGFDDCGRAIRLDEGQEPTQMVFGFRGQDGTVRELPPANQFSLDAPEGAVALRFYVEEFDGFNPDLGFRVHVRRGEMVLHELVAFGQHNFTIAVPDVFDFAVEGTDPSLAVELTLDSDPPLVPGATYYFSLTGAVGEDQEGFGRADITLRGESDIVPVQEEPTDEGAGCTGCQSRVVGRGSAPAPILFGLLVAVALGRRRRQ